MEYISELKDNFKRVFWLEQRENDMFCKYVACIACYAHS